MNSIKLILFFVAIFLVSCNTFKFHNQNDCIKFMEDIYENPTRIYEFDNYYSKFKKSDIPIPCLKDSIRISEFINMVNQAKKSSNPNEIYELYISNKAVEEFENLYIKDSTLYNKDNYIAYRVSNATIVFLFLKLNNQSYLIDIIKGKGIRKDWIPKSFQ